MLERDAFHEFHDDESASFMFLNVVNGADVRMIERGGSACFAAETFEGLGILGDIVGKKFQCDLAGQLGVIRLVDNSHAVTDQFFKDAILENVLAKKRRGTVR
jgi:hypothetical protein